MPGILEAEWDSAGVAATYPAGGRAGHWSASSSDLPLPFLHPTSLIGSAGTHRPSGWPRPRLLHSSRPLLHLQWLPLPFLQNQASQIPTQVEGGERSRQRRGEGRWATDSGRSSKNWHLLRHGKEGPFSVLQGTQKMRRVWEGGRDRGVEGAGAELLLSCIPILRLCLAPMGTRPRSLASLAMYPKVLIFSGPDQDF